MTVTCMNPVDGAKHEITDGARKVTLTTVVQWGEQDLRDDWTGEYVFCSFGCLAGWAAAKAEQHDGVFVRDGDDGSV